jgi:hypothetical protein
MLFVIFCVFLYKIGKKWSKNTKKWQKIEKH